ncbi:MAG: TCP-1/cpn60 chaperonin family protein [Thermoplasmata archaeon YP2-bin.285]|uniref:TCP-1/cpn60 chaperonin family protein n=1 Tax=Candidatus Sysuiplasma superficiale TaxID=2823368 RepID=A0A8J7YSC5_9ARCH|nr:TCP-1/cpn60 chaperonin family protein [Candidatus Sysuiplasma superficiale]
MLQGQPIIILREGTERDTGKSARHNNIAAAIAVADAVRSTLGPSGMDKMLVDSMGEVVITNDGATIMKELEIEHPAAKMLVEVAKTQDNEVGDGTTTAVILAGELLKRSEKLVEMNVHPTVIAAGFKMAQEKATEMLLKMAIEVGRKDSKTLKSIAETAVTGKNVGGDTSLIADLAVRAVLSVVDDTGSAVRADTDNIKVEKKHGAAVSDSQLIQGIVIDKERVHPRMPEFVENANIALVNQALEIKKTEVSSSIQIKDPSQIQRFLDQEESSLKEMADTLIKSGANVVICEKGISDSVQHHLSKAGIYAVQRAKKSDLEKLAKATGGKIIANVRDITQKDLGHSARVEQRKVSDEDMTFVTGCRNPKSVTVLLRAGTEHVAEELERAFNDAIRVVAAAIEDGKMVPGGGAVEIALALKLRDYASSVGGREQLAVEAFAESLEILPRILAENAGLDPIDTILELKTRHSSKESAHSEGISVDGGRIKDMVKSKVLEPVRVKKQVLSSATEVAIMILRIDDVIAAKKGSGAGQPPQGGMPPGMGGMPGMPPGMM